MDVADMDAFQAAMQSEGAAENLAKRRLGKAFAKGEAKANAALADFIAPIGAAGEVMGRMEAKVLLRRNHNRDEANCRFTGDRSASRACWR